VSFWEVRRIIRGYRKRNRLTQQLLAQCAYASIFAMRDPQGKTAADLFPELFDDDEPPITEEEADDLVRMMSDLNAKS
jgi:hypothetical protein